MLALRYENRCPVIAYFVVSSFAFINDCCYVHIFYDKNLMQAMFFVVAVNTLNNSTKQDHGYKNSNMKRRQKQVGKACPHNSRTCKGVNS